MKIVKGWKIPRMRLYPELFDNIKKLYDKFGQAEVDQETVAQLWGHKSAKSSQFRVVKLGSLRSYGLIEGRGKLRVSNLGKRLTYPETDLEVNDAIVEAVFPLLVHLASPPSTYPMTLSKPTRWRYVLAS